MNRINTLWIIIFFVFVYNDGIYKSTDGGSSWLLYDSEVWQSKNLRLAPNYPEINRLYFWDDVAFSPNFLKDSTIYAADGSTMHGSAVWISTDGGQAWKKLGNPENEVGHDSNAAYAIALSPDFETDHTILIGTHDGVFRSTTLPIKWKPMNHGLKLHFGIKNLTKSPYRLDTVPSIASDSDDNLHVVWWGTVATEDVSHTIYKSLRRTQK